VSVFGRFVVSCIYIWVLVDGVRVCDRSRVRFLDWSSVTSPQIVSSLTYAIAFMQVVRLIHVVRNDPCQICGQRLEWMKSPSPEKLDTVS
jgi:hypothetical protein